MPEDNVDLCALEQMGSLAILLLIASKVLAQQKLIKELKSEVEKFLRPQIRFYIRDILQRRIKMKDTEKATATLELDDAKGFPTGGAFDQPPVWSIDDPSIAGLTVSDDGLSCDVAGIKPGNAQLSVAGVAGGVSFAGACPVVVTSGDPTAIKVSLGDAVAQ